MKMTYDDYLGQAKILAEAGHNRSDVLKALRTVHLLNDGDLNPRDELGVLIADIENSQHDDLFQLLVLTHTRSDSLGF